MIISALNMIISVFNMIPVNAAKGEYRTVSVRYSGEMQNLLKSTQAAYYCQKRPSSGRGTGLERVLEFPGAGDPGFEATRGSGKTEAPKPDSTKPFPRPGTRPLDGIIR